LASAPEIGVSLTDQELINTFRKLTLVFEQALSEWDDFEVQRAMSELSSIAAELNARGYDLPGIMTALQHDSVESPPIREVR
jgi:hypothetical protein